jgi:hypothetical protein
MGLLAKKPREKMVLQFSDEVLRQAKILVEYAKSSYMSNTFLAGSWGGW